MAISFPTSLDNFTNPSSGNTLDSPSHSLQHSDINDAVEALERKIGVGTAVAGSASAGQVLTISAAGTSTWSTPTVPGMTFISTTSFTTSSAVSLPANTFTSTYRNYKIILNFTATNSAYLGARLRAAGSDDSTSNYGSAFNYQSLTASNPTGDTNATATQTSWTKLAYHPASNDHSVILEIFQPQITGKTTGVGFQSRSDAVFIYVGLLHQGSSSFDSMTFIPGAGTITGSVNVYGYNQ